MVALNSVQKDKFSVITIAMMATKNNESNLVTGK